MNFNLFDQETRLLIEADLGHSGRAFPTDRFPELGSATYTLPDKEMLLGSLLNRLPTV